MQQVFAKIDPAFKNLLDANRAQVPIQNIPKVFLQQQKN